MRGKIIGMNGGATSSPRSPSITRASIMFLFYTIWMEAITERYLKAFHGVPLTVELGHDASGDNVKQACARLHNYVLARARIMLLKAPSMSHEELDRAIEVLEQDERNITNDLLPEAPAPLLLDLVPKTLELVRDTRWKLMASRAELNRSEPAHTTASIAELNALFEQELSQ